MIWIARPIMYIFKIDLLSHSVLIRRLESINFSFADSETQNLRRWKKEVTWCMTITGRKERRMYPNSEHDFLWEKPLHCDKSLPTRNLQHSTSLLSLKSHQLQLHFIWITTLSLLFWRWECPSSLFVVYIQIYRLKVYLLSLLRWILVSLPKVNLV